MPEIRVFCSFNKYSVLVEMIVSLADWLIPVCRQFGSLVIFIQAFDFRGPDTDFDGGLVRLVVIKEVDLKAVCNETGDGRSATSNAT